MACGTAAQLSWQRQLGCLEVGEDLAGSVWAEKAAGPKGFFGLK
jgi:hypothetical protein